jgi:hypothetical protein
MGYYLPAGPVPVSDTWAGHLNRTPPSSEPGTDYASAVGTQLRCAADGTVSDRKTSTSGAMGRYVAVRLDDGRTVRYLHLQSVVVGVGDRVDRGGLLGYTGASANGSEYGVGAHVKTTLWPGEAWAAPTIDFEQYARPDPIYPYTPTEDVMYIVKATEPALRNPNTGQYIIQKDWQLAWTPGQPLKVLSSQEANLIASKQPEYPVPFVLWGRADIEKVIQSNGLVETDAYAAGASPSSRVRFTSDDYRYQTVEPIPDAAVQTHVSLPWWLIGLIGVILVVEVLFGVLLGFFPR